MGRPIIGILLAAVLLRLAFSFGYFRRIEGLRPELEVTDGHERIAESLYDGRGYRLGPGLPPTPERLPAYPAFLWLVFRAAGVNYAAVQVAQALLGALAAWILYRFGRWVLCERLGLWAAGLYAVYFTSIEYSARLHAENLHFPVFLALAWVLCLAVARGSARFGGFAGICLGLSLLTVGTLAAFPPFLAATLPILRRVRGGWRHWRRWMIPAALGTILVLSPWLARNYRLTGALLPVSTGSWAPFGWFRTMGPGTRILPLLLHLPLMLLFVFGSFHLARREPAAFARAWPAFLLVVFVELFQPFIFPPARQAAPAVALSLLWSGYGLEFLLRKDRACS